LLLGYAGAFRRSELVALDVEDLRFSAAGLYVWIAAAKNDPRKKGRELYVPRLPKTELCAVAALEAWLEVVGATGPVFRTFDLRGRLTSTRLDPGDVARILRRRCAAAGVAGDFRRAIRFGAGSSRTRRRRRCPIESIKRVTGQRSKRDRAGLRGGRDARRRPAALSRLSGSWRTSSANRIDASPSRVA
jgi:integrase